ncbi:UNVERIFIED_CONTAM: hypothetical protein HDU68_000442 [Siphonaria sp. JEL0065]|nr:hypothetical protein HDU68_000442 [Siphonaria sp. JEL0065]
MRTGYLSFDHDDILIHHDKPAEPPSRDQLEQLQKRWRQHSNAPLPPINATPASFSRQQLQQLQQLQQHQQRQQPVMKESLDDSAVSQTVVEPPRIKNTVRVVPPGYNEIEQHNRNFKEKEWNNDSNINIHNQQQQNGLVGLMETRGLADRIAGVERFIMAEMERLKDSIRNFDTLLSATQSQIQLLQSLPLTPQPLPPPPPPPQPQPLTPADILSLLQPFLNRLESATKQMESLDHRVSQLEHFTSATTKETHLLLQHIQSQIQEANSQQNLDKSIQQQQMQHQNLWNEQHVAVLIQAKVQEAVLGIEKEIQGGEEGFRKALESDREKSRLVVDALEKRVAEMEVESKERQIKGEQDLKVLLEGIVGVKQAMIQLGKGNAEKRMHEEYLQELKSVKDDLSASLRDTKDEFHRKLVSIARVSGLQ